MRGDATHHTRTVEEITREPHIEKGMCTPYNYFWKRWVLWVCFCFSNKHGLEQPECLSSFCEACLLICLHSLPLAYAHLPSAQSCLSESDFLKLCSACLQLLPLPETLLSSRLWSSDFIVIQAWSPQWRTVWYWHWEFRDRSPRDHQWSPGSGRDPA